MGGRDLCYAIQADVTGVGRHGWGIEVDFMRDSRAILYPGLRAPLGWDLGEVRGSL
jgi:hypothetical protein